MADNIDTSDLMQLTEALPDWEARVSSLFRYAQVGRCVNGVAHDINNILGAISAYAELAGLDPALSDDTRESLAEVVNSVSRCAALISNITSIARPDRLSASVAEAGRILGDAISLREYALRVDRIKLDRHEDETLPTIVADTPKVVLALLYLVCNAQEALRDVDEKIIRVGVRRTDEGVVFDVWNSGPPIPDSVRGVMFEPFTGSKEAHHLGQGLPAALAVAKLHEGSLDYDPESGFHLFLPSRNKLLSLVHER